MKFRSLYAIGFALACCTTTPTRTKGGPKFELKDISFDEPSSSARSPGATSESPSRAMPTEPSGFYNPPPSPPVEYAAPITACSDLDKCRSDDDCRFIPSFDPCGCPCAANRKHRAEAEQRARDEADPNSGCDATPECVAIEQAPVKCVKGHCKVDDPRAER